MLAATQLRAPVIPSSITQTVKSPQSISRSGIIEIVSTKRTARAVGAFEPPEEADTMKRVATRPAPFVGGLHVCPDDAVANGAFTLSFHRALNIPPKRDQTFNYAAGAEDDDLDRSEP